MVRPVNFLFFTLLFCGVLTLGGCAFEDYPSETELDPTMVPPGPPVVLAPCNYNDSGEVEGEYKMSGRMWETILNFSSYKEVRLAFNGATNQIRIQLHGGWEISDLQSQIVDFAKPSMPVITMDVAYPGFSGFQTIYTAVSGKLYIVKRSDGSYKYDWCEVIFEDPLDQSTRKSHGGFVLNP